VNRGPAYLVLFLLAVVLTILPAAMWADMAMPMKGQLGKLVLERATTPSTAVLASKSADVVSRRS